jgi:hypothetical protein
MATIHEDTDNRFIRRDRLLLTTNLKKALPELFLRIG